MRTMLFGTLSASLVAGCLGGDELDLATTDQALNGDTWATMDDNPYTGGNGAEYYGIAASPATHKVLVAGDRIEASGNITWIVRGSPNGSSGFGLNHTLKLAGGDNSEATNVAADATGVFYVVGESQDGSGTYHQLVIRSADDAATWTKVLDVTLGGHLTGITTDMQLNVYVSGTYVDGAGLGHAVIYKGADHGTAWSQVAVFDAVPGGNIDLGGMCVGNFSGVQHVFAVGGKSDSTAQNAFGWILHSGDHGATWQTAFMWQPQAATYAHACAGSPGSDVYVATGAMTNTGSTRWDGLDISSFSPLTFTDDAITSSGYTDAALGAAYAGTRPYIVGRIDDPGALDWRVRMKSGGVWLDSDIYQYPGATFHDTEAEAAAYDATRGLFVAGKAYDGTGRLRGIVRHRL